MAKTLRIFELAKELGVASKAIVAKCQAEEVPGITNHMSTVKLGLAQTIREWFSEGHTVTTAIEEAEQVDLNKAKKARRRRARRAGESDSDAATAVAEPEAEPRAEPAAAAADDEQQPEPQPEQEAAAPQPPADQPPVEAEAVAQTPAQPEAQTPAPAEAQAAAEQQPAVEEPAPVEAQAAGEPVAAEAEQQVQAQVDDEAEKAASVGPVGRPNVPDRPTDVAPAGEQLTKPKTVKLRGPNVVRIEKADELAPPRPRRAPGPGRGGPVGGEDDSEAVTRSRGPQRGRGAGVGRTDAEADKRKPKRRSLTSRRGRYAESFPTGPTKFTEADLAELDARLNRSKGYVKRRQQDLRKREGGTQALTPVDTGGKVEVEEPLFIKDLSSATGIKAADIIKYLFTRKGVMVSINSAIDAEAAAEVCMEYDIELVVKAQKTAEEKVLAEFESRETLDARPRPPVVTVLGHVDHGKTSLLDRIRRADVAAHEDGGITQHVGAYRVTIEGQDNQEKTVVFLDTPGHEAFTSMRARGASITDIVVLVVAADDGVMPQTVESINHAKAAGVPIVVAMNKCDLPAASEEKTRQIYGQLAEHGLNPVAWGGDTEVLRTSAQTGEGVTELMEMLDLQAEMLELKADYGGRAMGTVIEAEMQEGRGPVARVLVEDGQIAVGDFIVIGRAFGRVRDMTDDRGRSIREAGPATPIELSGIDMVPDAGNKFYVTDTLKKAEDVANQYREIEREQQLASKTKVTLDNFAQQLKAGQMQELRVVLKADVQGSLDVLRASLEKIGNDEVGVRVLHSGVGGVNESDVLLAEASDAVIVGFHVVAPPAVRDIAEQRGVDVRLYRVIYDLTDNIKKALEGMLAPDTHEETIGQAEVREVFRVSKVGMIAGCLVTEGSVRADGKARVVRDGVTVTENRDIASLKRVKDDVREVRQGTECGIHVSGFDDVKPGDVIVCYRVVEVKRKLD